MAKESAFKGPLTGLKILDLATLIAGPWAATLLSDLGAEVLKVEMPGAGDPLRALPPHKNEIPLWWKTANRNKRGITLDLRKDDAKQVLARLVKDHDVLVENFRPGTLDRWGITQEWLHALNPGLTILRVTGFGQDGPYRDRPGFARAAEAMSGLTHICGEEDGAPQHMGFPIADAVTGLFGAVGILSALYRKMAHSDTEGQEIDCSLFESMFRVLDFLPIEYDQLGKVRGRSGNLSQYSAPSNVFKTSDERWISIVGSTQSIFERLCQALQRPDILADPRFACNVERVAHRDALDSILAEVMGSLTLEHLSKTLTSNAVAFSAIFDISDIFADPHVAARRAIVTVPDEELGPLRMQSAVPLFSRTPGAVRQGGPALGQHTDEVLQEIGIDAAQRAELAALQVI